MKIKSVLDLLLFVAVFLAGIQLPRVNGESYSTRSGFSPQTSPCQAGQPVNLATRIRHLAAQNRTRAKSGLALTKEARLG